jgi:hypothetical protein
VWIHETNNVYGRNFCDIVLLYGWQDIKNVDDLIDAIMVRLNKRQK